MYVSVSAATRFVSGQSTGKRHVIPTIAGLSVAWISARQTFGRRYRAIVGLATAPTAPSDHVRDGRGTWRARETTLDPPEQGTQALGLRRQRIFFRQLADRRSEVVICHAFGVEPPYRIAHGGDEAADIALGDLPKIG